MLFEMTCHFPNDYIVRENYTYVVFPKCINNKDSALYY